MSTSRGRSLGDAFGGRSNTTTEPGARVPVTKSRIDVVGMPDDLFYGVADAQVRVDADARGTDPARRQFLQALARIGLDNTRGIDCRRPANGADPQAPSRRRCASASAPRRSPGPAEQPVVPRLADAEKSVAAMMARKVSS